MNLTDPVADFLTRIRNSIRARHQKLDVPASKLKAEIARISSVIGDPTHVLIAGLQPGLARVSLTDADGKTETFDVVVQLDVEYLKYLLRIGVPTASINVQPGASGTVILTGYLTRAEDIQLALDIARSVVGDRIINGLRMGGVQQVQLDVVVAQVARSELRRMAFDFIQAGQHHIITSTVGNALTFPSAGLEARFVPR